MDTVGRGTSEYLSSTQSQVNSLAEDRLTLLDFVNTKILNSIQDKFTQVTGVHCVITNTEGQPLTKIDMFTRFCKLIRSIPEGRGRCEECDRLKSMEAAGKGEAIYYKCHAGLIDAAMPIVVNSQHIGNFLCGQVALDDDPLEYDDIKRRVGDLNIEESLFVPYLGDIEIVSKEKLITALEMMTFMTNYIAELGAVNIAQKQLMIEMKAKAKLQNILKETEYKALLAQINPHFLFNCLNTIGRVALIEEAYKTQDLIYAMSDILRNLLKQTDQFVTLDDEMRYVCDYLKIQQARFGDRIKVSINIDEDTLNVKLPKFTIQPLVENAITHGLEPKKEGGMLTIKAYLLDGNLVIDVIDTGVGIPINWIHAMREKNDELIPSDHVTGLGLANVHQRIRYYFGIKYGLEIDNQPVQGCRVRITVPCMKK
jgi:two-component system, LytTR family, sensor kinase